MPSTRKPDEHRDLSREARENLASEFRDYLKRTELTPVSIRLYEGAAKHFLIWAVRDRIDLTSVDDNTLRRFRFHDCGCPLAEEGLPRHKRCTPQLLNTTHGVVPDRPPVTNGGPGPVFALFRQVSGRRLSAGNQG